MTIQPQVCPDAALCCSNLIQHKKNADKLFLLYNCIHYNNFKP